MYINASFDFAAGATQSDISQFQNAVNIVINYFESVFTNVNVTLNVKFAYGEQYAGNPGGSADHLYADGQCNEHRHFRFSARAQSTWNSYNYTTVRNQLLTESDTLQSSAYSTLPATSPFPSNDTLWVSSAQQKALGLPPSNTNGSTSGTPSAASTGSSASSATRNSQQEGIRRIGPRRRRRTTNSTTCSAPSSTSSRR